MEYIEKKKLISPSGMKRKNIRIMKHTKNYVSKKMYN